MKRTSKSHKKIEFDQITEYLYLGTNMCCTMHFKNLLNLGIKADIDLEFDRLEKPKSLDIFLWLPTRDHAAPTPAQLLSGAKFIDALVSQRIKTYVHCQKGHGRAPTLVAAYFILKGMEVSKAVELVKKRRPITHINKVQMEALWSFASSVV